MLQHSNIDRPDSVQISKAPFTYESTLDLLGYAIAPGSFASLKVYVESTALVPFRFHSITPDGKLNICDRTGAIVAYWQTHATTEPDTEIVSSLLFNKNGVIAGHVACSPSVVSAIRAIAEGNTEIRFLPANAFVLIPQCHIAMLTGYGRAFKLISQGTDETLLTSNLYLDAADDSECVIQTPLITGSTVSFSMKNTSETLRKRAPYNGICAVAIDGSTYSCEHSSIIIKAETLSNLRVLKENGNLVLRGVLDA